MRYPFGSVERSAAPFVVTTEARNAGSWEADVRYLLMFHADEDAWMALPEVERDAAIGRIQRSGDAPIVTDGPFVEAKEGVGSYAIVEARDRDEAVEIAKTWPAGGLVEIRPVDEGGPIMGPMTRIAT